MVRAQVLDTVAETHVQMIRALGFSERSVYSRFAMKLAWNPVAAAVALVFGYSLVNTFLVRSAARSRPPGRDPGPVEHP
jgi:peptide/nickel transport system permease protein